MYPECIPNVSEMYSRYIPDSSKIPHISRIHSRFIPNDRLIRNSTVYPAYIQDSKAGRYFSIIIKVFFFMVVL